MRHAPWRVATFVVGFQMAAARGRRMRRPYICPLGQWVDCMFMRRGTGGTVVFCLFLHDYVDIYLV